MPDLSHLTQAMYTRLVGYGPLIADLPTYKSAPAVLSGFIVPPQAPLPRVVISAESVSDRSQDDVSALIREVMRDVYVFTGRGTSGTSSENPIERIAENVRSALHLFFLPLPGWKCIIAQASGPRNAPTDETVAGRVITVRYQFSQT